MTTKGQVTIPLAVRTDLRLEAGVRVEFRRGDDGSYSLRAATRPVSDLFGCLPPHRGPALTVEEMSDRMAAGAAEANR
jgi:AbrB family looped-hinge helix DNA binding protein